MQLLIRNTLASPEVVISSKRSTWILFIPLAMALLPVAIAVIAAVIPADGAGLGLIAGVFWMWVFTSPVSVGGYVWLLVGVYRLRPIRGRGVQWVFWTVMVVYAVLLAFLGGSFILKTIPEFGAWITDSIGQPMVVAFAVAAVLGLAGLAVGTLSLMPRRIRSAQSATVAGTDLREGRPGR